MFYCFLSGFCRVNIRVSKKASRRAIVKGFQECGYDSPPRPFLHFIPYFPSQLRTVILSHLRLFTTPYPSIAPLYRSTVSSMPSHLASPTVLRVLLHMCDSMISLVIDVRRHCLHVYPANQHARVAGTCPLNWEGLLCPRTGGLRCAGIPRTGDIVCTHARSLFCLPCFYLFLLFFLPSLLPLSPLAIPPSPHTSYLHPSLSFYPSSSSFPSFPSSILYLIGHVTPFFPYLLPFTLKYFISILPQLHLIRSHSA
jgi:hypothetical protein